jgi:hypothetical protein
MRNVGILALALSIGFAGVAVAAERLAVDTSFTTGSGATFTAPSGWSVTVSANKSVLDPPEADSHLALDTMKPCDRRYSNHSE